MADFRKLKVWQAAHRLAVHAHRASVAMPGCDRFELGSQIRRAAISVVSNIAEGNGRRGDREFSRFLRIALGSAHELESQILIAKDLESFDSPTSQSLIDSVAEVRRMLFGLIRQLKAES
jgi:four helix bundle protein